MTRNVLLLVSLCLAIAVAGCGSTPDEASAPESPAGALPTPEPVVMQFHQEGGIAGFCDDVAVHADGMIEYQECGQSANTATLTQSERDQLEGWVAKFSDFTLKAEDNPGGPDNLVRELQFDGRGETPATEEQKHKMLTWIEGIYGELAQQPAPGDSASAAGRVVEVMSEEVIVIEPDEPGHDVIVVTPETQFQSTNGQPASLADVRPGMRVEAQGTALGAGGLQAESVTIEKESDN